MAENIKLPKRKWPFHESCKNLGEPDGACSCSKNCCKFKRLFATGRRQSTMLGLVWPIGPGFDESGTDLG